MPEIFIRHFDLNENSIETRHTYAWLDSVLYDGRIEKILGHRYATELFVQQISCQKQKFLCHMNS